MKFKIEGRVWEGRVVPDRAGAEGWRMTGSAFEIYLGTERFRLRCTRRDLRLKMGRVREGNVKDCPGIRENLGVGG